jgi:hypothetical protein
MEAIRHGSCRLRNAITGNPHWVQQNALSPMSHASQGNSKFRLPDPCLRICPLHAICLLAMMNECAHQR